MVAQGVKVSLRPADFAVDPVIYEVTLYNVYVRGCLQSLLVRTMENISTTLQVNRDVRIMAAGTEMKTGSAHRFPGACDSRGVANSGISIADWKKMSGQPKTTEINAQDCEFKLLVL